MPKKHLELSSVKPEPQGPNLYTHRMPVLEHDHFCGRLVTKPALKAWKLSRAQLACSSHRMPMTLKLWIASARPEGQTDTMQVQVKITIDTQLIN